MSSAEAASAEVISLESYRDQDSYQSLEIYYPDERTNRIQRARKAPANVMTLEVYHPDEPTFPEVVTSASGEGEASISRLETVAEVPALLRTSTSPYRYHFDPETNKALREVATLSDGQSHLERDPTLVDEFTYEESAPEIVREIVVLPPKRAQQSGWRGQLRFAAIIFSLGLGVGMGAMWLFELLK